jgi:hypothetical protein
MNKQGLVLSIVLLVTGLLHAHVTPIKTLDRFNHTIINEPLVVAYLYDDMTNQTCSDKQERHQRKQEINKNLAVLKAVSRNERYFAPGIRFLQANLDKNCLDELKNTYHLTDHDSLLLFDKETALDSVLTGNFNRSQVENFIEDQWQEKIDTILKQQAEERKQRLAELRANQAYWGTGPYWCWPYGFGGCGWNGCWAPCRPYIGFGFGFGGCC